MYFAVPRRYNSTGRERPCRGRASAVQAGLGRWDQMLRIATFATAAAKHGGRAGAARRRTPRLAGDGDRNDTPHPSPAMPDHRSHRGPHPEDAGLFAPAVHPTLRSAVADLSWLLTRGYADPSALKLVGDR